MLVSMRFGLCLGQFFLFLSLIKVSLTFIGTPPVLMLTNASKRL
uniref:Uncharacterized protein n=1 Tax=Anguilla anguilla TaxID=7936 RepID=A0A0E9RS98_ANGAN